MLAEGTSSESRGQGQPMLVPAGSSALTEGTADPISQIGGASESVFRKMPQKQRRSGEKNRKSHLVLPTAIINPTIFNINPQTL